jgi:hypothetical protein
MILFAQSETYRILFSQKIRVDDIIQNPLGIEIIDYEIIKRNIMK